MRCLVVVGLLAIAGCGPAEPSVYPVTGTVKFESGASPTDCVVELSSQADATKGMNARAEVAADGTFTLKTLVNNKEKSGAVAGQHKVIVVAPPASSSGGPAPPTISPKYSDYNQSVVTFEVKPGAANTLNITIPAGK